MKKKAPAKSKKSAEKAMHSHPKGGSAMKPGKASKKTAKPAPKKSSGKVKAPAIAPAKKALKKPASALPPKHAETLERVRAILSKPAGSEAKMLEICWLLNSKFPHYNWVGFYISTGNRELALGPFVGEPTEHVRIPFGRGICGQAAETKKTFVVDDVSKESNYLSCSMYVRSEIVVPIIVRDEIAGELDIDSHAPNAFTKDDRALLEKVCVELSGIF
jgi:GAF domain-containing protein